MDVKNGGRVPMSASPTATMPMKRRRVRPGRGCGRVPSSAPWDWRVRNKKTVILGAVKPRRRACHPGWRRPPARVAPFARMHHQGTVNRQANASITRRRAGAGSAVQDEHRKGGTRWFCSNEEAEAAGCRETQGRMRPTFLPPPRPSRERVGVRASQRVWCRAMDLYPSPEIRYREYSDSPEPSGAR